jgi:UDP-glucose 4-epimerase
MAGPQAKPTLLITGATGFVGTRLCEAAISAGWRVCTLVRNASRSPPGTEPIPVGDLATSPDRLAQDIQAALKDSSPSNTALIHLAARAHVLRETDTDPAAAFHRDNVIMSVNIARAASLSGITRFVYVSSIGAVGDSTAGVPLDETAACRPATPYGCSKLAAERELQELQTPGLVIVRPPLVYGRGAPGNMARLRQLVSLGIPLPFGAVNNQRSLIHVSNLVDCLLLCSTDARASGQIFHVRDAVDYSTPELLQLAGQATGRRVRLIPVPVGPMNALARSLGLGNAMEKMLGSLQVSDRRIVRELKWRPDIFPFEI